MTDRLTGRLMTDRLTGWSMTDRLTGRLMTDRLTGWLMTDRLIEGDDGQIDRKVDDRQVDDRQIDRKVDDRQVDMDSLTGRLIEKMVGVAMFALLFDYPNQYYTYGMYFRRKMMKHVPGKGWPRTCRWRPGKTVGIDILYNDK